MARRRFGRVRRLPSGRYQARYLGPDGIDRPAPDTFASKTDADIWLTMKEAEIRHGDWLNPDAGAILIADYGAAWIEERPGLRPKTVTLYRYLLRAHITPYFQTVTVAAITLAVVRRWRKKLRSVRDFARKEWPLRGSPADVRCHGVLRSAGG